MTTSPFAYNRKAAAVEAVRWQGRSTADGSYIWGGVSKSAPMPTWLRTAISSNMVYDLDQGHLNVHENGDRHMQVANKGDWLVRDGESSVVSVMTDQAFRDAYDVPGEPEAAKQQPAPEPR